jgi:predicted dehydrogenase
MVHAPVLAAGPETRLAGVWARRPEAASELAGRHGVPAFARYEELLDACQAVACCVAPDAQPDLAVAAAGAGKALMLEKPLALSIDEARRLTEAIGEAGVRSVVVLTYRFSAAAREFLDGARHFDAFGGRACFLSGAFLGGPFATPWRLEHGALLDVGPHVVDLIDAALGPVEGVRAHGDPHLWVGLMLEHGGGAASEVSLSSRTAIEPNRTEVEVYGTAGSRFLDARASVGPETFATLRREVAAAARGEPPGPHTPDAFRALFLQQVLEEAGSQLQGR